MRLKNPSKKSGAAGRILGLLGYASSAVLFAQTTIVGGKGSVNINTNNGTVIVKNFDMTAETRKELEAFSRRYSGSGNGWQGVLVPGSKSANYGSCASVSDHLADLSISNSDFQKLYFIRLGGLTGMCLTLPCNVLAINGKPQVTLIRSKGSIGVQATFMGEGGKAIASIDGDVVHVNQHIAWYFKRNDAHSMSVFDQDNREVLWVSLENRNYIRLRAIILDAAGKTIATIDDSKVSFDASSRDLNSKGATATFEGTCITDTDPPTEAARTVLLNISLTSDGRIEVESHFRF